MGKRYTIGEVERITGISKDRLRNYDKLELLSPKKDDGNSYRQYSENDIIEIMSIEHMRSMDLGMKNIKSIRESGELDEFLSILENKQEEVQRSIDALLCIKKNIQNAYDDGRRIREELNVFTIRKMDKFHVVGELSGSTAFDEYVEVRKKRKEDLPIIQSIVRKITFSEEGIVNNQVYIVEKTECDEIMHERCLTIVVKEVVSEDDILVDTYHKCMEWLKENKETPLGVVYARPILINNTLDELATYIEICLPLK